MSLLLKLLGLVTLLELVVWLPPLFKWHRLTSPVVMVVLSAVTIGLLLRHPSVPIGVIALMSAYRVCNLWRLLRGRMHADYLRRAAIQASVWIVLLQAVTLALWGVADHFRATTYHLWLVLGYVELAGALVLLLSTLRHVRKTRPPKVAAVAVLADRDLPTVTVAIPARNETDDLEACLQSLVALNYPKLEILVLDDCSQNKRTPEIIRSFAHAGVRFLEGTTPSENWLAKNQAYQRLLEVSNGELLLFCGVDARFEPHSLRQLVAAMLHKDKSMVSIIPKNTPPTPFSWQDSSLLQPMRYAWELALPRKLFRRPPVLSTCWIIKRATLESAGGFAAVSRSIVPESYFARVSAVHDGYSFMQSGPAIGIISDKKFDDQRDTTIRTRYPQVHRRLELVLLITLAELLGMVMPYVLLLVAIFGHLSLQLTVIAAAAVVSITLAYLLIVALTYRLMLTRAFVTLPFAIILDILLLNYSMLRYEFSDVVWKGRNVCIPVMHMEKMR